jgi:death-on-curing protein
VKARRVSSKPQGSDLTKRVDGNKHAGFVVGVLFLELHGHDFKASEEDATQAVLDLAAGTLDETAYAAWLRTNVKPKRGR